MPIDAPQYESGVVAPDCLDDIAKAEWERMLPVAEQQGLITIADQAEFIGYCCAYSAMIRIQQEVKNAESLTDVKQGSATPLGELKKAIELVSKIAIQFGWTPASRTRVTIEKIKGASKLAELEDRLFG